MKRINPGLMGALASLALLSPGVVPKNIDVPVPVIKEVPRRGNGGRGKPARNPLKNYSRYIMPAGPNKNVKGPQVRNPKIAAQMNAMHDALYFKKFGVAPDPY